MSSQDSNKPIKPEVVNEPFKAGPVKPGSAKPSFKVTRSPLAAKARPVGVPRPPKRPAASPNIATVPPILGRTPLGGGVAGKAAKDGGGEPSAPSRKDTIPSSAPDAPLPTQSTKPKAASISAPRPGNIGAGAAPAPKKAPEKKEEAKESPVVESKTGGDANIAGFAIDLLSALAAVVFTVFLATKL